MHILTGRSRTAATPLTRGAFATVDPGADAGSGIEPDDGGEPCTDEGERHA
jgi:hypothetical protein